MKNPKVLQTFGNGKNFTAFKDSQTPINARNMDGKINFMTFKNS